jgi:hypothetical protein
MDFRIWSVKLLRPPACQEQEGGILRNAAVISLQRPSGDMRGSTTSVDYIKVHEISTNEVPSFYILVDLDTINIVQVPLIVTAQCSASGTITCIEPTC